MLLTVGQIGLRKGWDTLAAAAAKLPDVYFLLVGARFSKKAESVRYEEDARAAFARVAPGRHRWLGVRDDVPALMGTADLLVHPARQEPFGRVLLEAAAAGLPVVATDPWAAPANCWATTSPRSPPTTPAPWPTPSRRLLSDAPHRTALAASARDRVTTRFTADRAAAGLGDVWAAVLP